MKISINKSKQKLLKFSEMSPGTLFMYGGAVHMLLPKCSGSGARYRIFYTDNTKESAYFAINLESQTLTSWEKTDVPFTLFNGEVILTEE